MSFWTKIKRTVIKAYRLWDKSFKFNGKTYRYELGDYNASWENERTVEIPIMKKYIKGDVLEVGNTLSHYTGLKAPTNHLIIDKYEKASGVINEDIEFFDTSQRFDTIILVSTLEHIGNYQGEPKVPEKLLRAIENMKRLLKPAGGKIIASVPLGQNPVLDCLIDDGNFRILGCMKKKICELNTWKETYWHDAIKTKGCKHCLTHAITIIEIKN